MTYDGAGLEYEKHLEAALQQAKDERDGLQAWAEKREVRLTEAEATIERLTEDLTMRTDDLDRAAVTIERLRADLAASAADCDEAIAQETERLRAEKLALALSLRNAVGVYKSQKRSGTGELTDHWLEGAEALLPDAIYPAALNEGNPE